MVLWNPIRFLSQTIGIGVYLPCLRYWTYDLIIRTKHTVYFNRIWLLHKVSPNFMDSTQILIIFYLGGKYWNRLYNVGITGSCGKQSTLPYNWASHHENPFAALPLWLKMPKQTKKLHFYLVRLSHNLSVTKECSSYFEER